MAYKAHGPRIPLTNQDRNPGLRQRQNNHEDVRRSGLGFDPRENLKRSGATTQHDIPEPLRMEKEPISQNSSLHSSRNGSPRRLDPRANNSSLGPLSLQRHTTAIDKSPKSPRVDTSHRSLHQDPRLRRMNADSVTRPHSTSATTSSPASPAEPGLTISSGPSEDVIMTDAEQVAQQSSGAAPSVDTEPQRPDAKDSPPISTEAFAQLLTKFAEQVSTISCVMHEHNRVSERERRCRHADRNNRNDFPEHAVLIEQGREARKNAERDLLRVTTKLNEHKRAQYELVLTLTKQFESRIEQHNKLEKQQEEDGNKEKFSAEIHDFGERLSKMATDIEEVKVAVDGLREEARSMKALNSNAAPLNEFVSLQQSLTEVEKRLKDLQTAGNNAQLDLIQSVDRADLKALRHAVADLTSRYNNLTTEPIAKAMVQQMQIMYPHASRVEVEIPAIKAEVANVQRLYSKIDQLISQVRLHSQEIHKANEKVVDLHKMQAISMTKQDQMRMFLGEERDKLNDAIQQKADNQKQDLEMQSKQFEAKFDEIPKDLKAYLFDLDARVKEVRKETEVMREEVRMSTRKGTPATPANSREILETRSGRPEGQPHSVPARLNGLPSMQANKESAMLTPTTARSPEQETDEMLRRFGATRRNSSTWSRPVITAVEDSGDSDTPLFENLDSLKPRRRVLPPTSTPQDHVSGSGKKKRKRRDPWEIDDPNDEDYQPPR